MKQFSETSSMFARDNVKIEANLRDSLIFRSWQHQKRSNSARLLHFLNLTTSKTQQFCETSSFFKVDNIKNEAIMRDFLQKWKVDCSADGLVPMRFAIFPLHLSKVPRLPRKSDARSYEVLHLSLKIISAHLKIWCSKMQPLSGNQRPDLLTSLTNMSFVLRLPREMHLCRTSSNVPRLTSFLDILQNPHVLAHFWWRCTIPCACHAKQLWMSKSGPTLKCFVHFDFEMCFSPQPACTFSTSQLPKLVRQWCVLYMFTSKCASRHNGMHFFDISTSKSALRPRCFVPVHFEMCFAPQRHALFRHLNFQKWSDNGVFCTCSLRNVLCATTACTFSTSQLPKVVRHWSVLYILTSKCASRHNGVHFFNISTSKSGPTLVCFVHVHFEMCFAPQRRALFRHLNFQNWSDNGVFCTCSLRNVLRATTACAFSTSQLPKVLWDPGVLYLFTWKCASCHNGVQFSSLIWPAGSAPAALASLLSTLRSHKSLEKHSVSRLPTFSRICICFLLTLSLLWSSLFYSPLLSASAQLCFSSVHIVGSLTSKLPSTMTVLQFYWVTMTKYEKVTFYTLYWEYNIP